MGRKVYNLAKNEFILDENPVSSPGAEGAVYRIISPGNFGNHCVKIYHENKRTKIRQNKIAFMVHNKPSELSSSHYVICWPDELIFDNLGNFLGFKMPLAFDHSQSLYVLTRPNINNSLLPKWIKYNRSEKAGMINRHKICVNIAIAINSIHKSWNYVIVDFKPQNILLTLDGKISITDVDSFQIASQGAILFNSEVATPEYLPPESVNENPSKNIISANWDRFAMAVVFYEILFGIHPFAATGAGLFQNVSTIGEKIQNRLYVHGPNRSKLSVIPPLHNDFNTLRPQIITLFNKTFTDGLGNPNLRVTAELWGKTIHKELLTPHFIVPCSAKVEPKVVKRTSTQPKNPVETKPPNTSKTISTTTPTNEPSFSKWLETYWWLALLILLAILRGMDAC